MFVLLAHVQIFNCSRRDLNKTAWHTESVKTSEGSAVGNFESRFDNGVISNINGRDGIKIRLSYRRHSTINRCLKIKFNYGCPYSPPHFDIEWRYLGTHSSAVSRVTGFSPENSVVLWLCKASTLATIANSCATSLGAAVCGLPQHLAYSPREEGTWRIQWVRSSNRGKWQQVRRPPSEGKVDHPRSSLRWHFSCCNYVLTCKCLRVVCWLQDFQTWPPEYMHEAPRTVTVSRVFDCMRTLMGKVPRSTCSWGLPDQEPCLGVSSLKVQGSTRMWQDLFIPYRSPGSLCWNSRNNCRSMELLLQKTVFCSRNCLHMTLRRYWINDSLPMSVNRRSPRASFRWIQTVTPRRIVAPFQNKVCCHEAKSQCNCPRWFRLLALRGTWSLDAWPVFGPSMLQGDHLPQKPMGFCG